jgi:hypothetical protein
MIARRCTIAALSAASLLVAGPAAAKATSVVNSPWIALSAFAAPASSEALCGAAAAAAGGAAIQGTSGCVFPTVDALVAPPIAQAAPLAAPAVAAAGGVAILPLLVGLAALVAASAFLIARGDGGDTQISISP